MINKYNNSYDYIISLENLLVSWRSFLRGKRKKKDVQEYSYSLMDNILALHSNLKNSTYIHGIYNHFRINDPKPRDIHKATVQDRLIHHLVYRSLYPYFDEKFIYCSFSCRKNKGVHKAINKFREYCEIVSKGKTRQCWVLKCDIKKFFASIDHETLCEIVNKYIHDSDIIKLIKVVVDSFNSGKNGKGLPLGNLTSQLLVNIYMNEFDQFIKHHIKAKYYIRYADDFVIISDQKAWLEMALANIKIFLQEKLKLILHPNKVFIKTYSSGVDFLGWVHFPYCRILRTTTKYRMFRKLEKDFRKEVFDSYLGLLKHGNSFKLMNDISKMYK